MKKEFKYLSVISLLLMSLCLPSVAVAKSKEKKASKKDIAWFDSREWLQGLNAHPDESIDIETFAEHYKKHPDRWITAFKYLKENDISTLPLGSKTLAEGVTVNVQEYMTNEPGKEWLEGHKKQIDLQFVVEGAELQGYAKIWTANETVNPYTEKRDVGHYTVPAINYHVIRSNQFTIFFPDDIHIPNIQYGEKAKVRKIVFKIAVD